MFFRRARDERGSIVIAVAALSVIASLGAVIITRSIANTRATLAAQQRAAATAMLDYAASVATARIDQGETASFTTTGTINGINWGIGASRIDDDYWTVRVAAGAVPNSKAARFKLTRASGGGFEVSRWREEANWSATLAVLPGADWSPANVVTSGLNVALDASDLANLSQDSAGTTPVTSVGQSVCKWADTSGNTHHATQATTAKCPVYGIDSVGRYLQFDANGWYTFSAAVSPDVTAFVVAQSTVTPYNAYAWILSARSANGFIIHNWTGGTTVTSYLNDSIPCCWTGTETHTVSNITSVTLYELGVTGSGAVTVRSGENGTTIMSSASNFTRVAGTVTAYIGADALDSLNRMGQGRYREVLLYNRYLTADERAQVESYLMSKWGIS